MAVQAVNEPTGKKVGTTTVGATAGTGLAGAAAVVLVWILGEVGVNVPAEVAGALAVLIGGVGTLIGGKLSPSNQRTEVAVPVDLGATSQVTPEPGVVIPDGDGAHRAEDPESDLTGDHRAEHVEPDPVGSTVVDDAPIVTETTVKAKEY